ncbi:MAG: hypothetical protein A2068_09290 [Ignavibacteria bacterium GWB2_35_6b]|nr:MAG: hypothetical protein A2068_09290 [Ignavibacteria bacterium GWB2_35_6b]
MNKQIALSLPYKGRVIDLGCGSSPYKKIIQQMSREYIGVDWNNTLHDKSNVDVFANICKGFPFKDCSVDTVVCFQVLEHLQEPNFFLSECYRILRPGGKLLITVPFMWHIHEAPYDYFRYTRYGLEYLLLKNEFSDILIYENTGFWQMWILKLNYHINYKFSGKLLNNIWVPILWLGQILSPMLDKYDKHPQETVSYTCIASKA